MDDLISRKALIKELQEISTLEAISDHTGDMMFWVDKKAVYKVIKKLPTIQPQGIDKDRLINEMPTSDGWIPVSSGELPKVKEPVLITYKHNQGFIIRDVAYLSEVGEWHINTLGWLLDGGKVLAWQPLPQPYKESE